MSASSAAPLGTGATHPAAAPLYVDLQVHTTASDGVLSPTAVVEEAARKKNLVAIAITDHDSIDGVPEAEIAGERLGIRIVVGVELAAHFETDEFHILGLHLTNRESISGALESFREERVERAISIVRILNANDIPISMDAVISQAAGGAIGRPHVARAMIAGGWVTDFREAFDRWLGWGKPAFVEKGKLTVRGSVELIHRAGGLAVWAHPGDFASEERLRKLQGEGLDGVEVLHPGHSPSLAQRIHERAERLGLLSSGGSDWHGTAEGPRQLGGQMVPYRWLAQQDEALAERLG